MEMDKLIRTDCSDANNNDSIINVNTMMGSSNSYSLRPRSLTSRSVVDEESGSEWKPRSRSKRRPKQKPPPLSKYRRKTANARERSRMREINEAFESLRRAIPHLADDSTTNEKMTKITTLRLAMKYIAALNRVLQDPDPESDLEYAEYALSLTPTSSTDNSDLSDQFLLSDPSSTSSSVFGFDPARSGGVPMGSFLASACYFTPTDNTSMIDIREHCLTPSDLNTDFDSIASPSVDFDDFFVS